MKLTVLQWRDLAAFLDRVPQKDLPTTADVRKCVGSVEQIRDNINFLKTQKAVFLHFCKSKGNFQKY